MATVKLQLGLILVLALLGCTDRRPKFLATDFRQPAESPVKLVATVQFQNQPTEAMQLEIQGDSLFMTGRPFGVARLDVGADQVNPTLTFAASNSIEAFSPYPAFGFWTPDNFAQGALTIWGKMVFMSGAAGISIVDVSQTHTPVEIARYPSEKINGVQVSRDPAYVYAAIVHHPSLPLLYGFSEQDYIYTLSANNSGVQSGVQIIQKDAYGPQNVCCAMGAAVTGNRVVLAMRASLWTFDFSQNGQLTNANRIDTLQAVNVVTTNRFIYIQHKPISSNGGSNGGPNGSTNAPGIYVFDIEGSPVSFLPINPLRFAVYNDQYIYANMENTQVSIFAIR